MRGWWSGWEGEWSVGEIRRRPIPPPFFTLSLTHSHTHRARFNPCTHPPILTLTPGCHPGARLPTLCFALPHVTGAASEWCRLALPGLSGRASVPVYVCGGRSGVQPWHSGHVVGAVAATPHPPAPAHHLLLKPYLFFLFIFRSSGGAVMTEAIYSCAH